VQREWPAVVRRARRAFGVGEAQFADASVDRAGEQPGAPPQQRMGALEAQQRQQRGKSDQRQAGDEFHVAAA
jgi:hypothetical protein